MDMLLAAATDALARRAFATEQRLLTPAEEEDSYYARHTLNVIVPIWVPGLFALLAATTAPRPSAYAPHATPD